MRRIIELDALRPIWAIMILFAHATDDPCFFGWSRVDLFFVLSGFVLTRKLVADHETSHLRLSSFFRDRALRLLPGYYALLIVLFALDSSRWESSHLGGLLKAITFTANVPLYWSWNFEVSYYSYMVVHMWTLEIEIVFCCLWPVIVRLFGRTGLTILSLFMLVDSVCLRAGGLHPWTFLARSDGLALGSLLALLSLRPGPIAKRWVDRLSVAAGLLGLGYLIWFWSYSGMVIRSFDRPLGLWQSLAVLATNLFYAGMIGLIARHTGWFYLGLLRLRWLGYFGRFSYGIYLYSFAAMALAGLALGRGPYARDWQIAFLALTFSVVLSMLARWLIEQPLGRLARRHAEPMRRTAEYPATASSIVS